MGFRSPDKRSAIRESSLSFCAARSGVAESKNTGRDKSRPYGQDALIAPLPPLAGEGRGRGRKGNAGFRFWLNPAYNADSFVFFAVKWFFAGFRYSLNPAYSAHRQPTRCAKNNILSSAGPFFIISATQRECSVLTFDNHVFHITSFTLFTLQRGAS